MADLSITAANVAKSTGATTANVIAGETITAGQSVYKSDTNNRYYLTDNNDTAAKAVALGIALNGAAAGQPLQIQRTGVITIGATVAIGVTYCVSANAGGICPDADVSTGGTRYKTVLGVGVTASTILLGITASGVTVA